MKQHYTAQRTAHLVTFTEEILNRKLHFLCSVNFFHGPRYYFYQLLSH